MIKEFVENLICSTISSFIVFFITRRLLSSNNKSKRTKRSKREKLYTSQLLVSDIQTSGVINSIIISTEKDYIIAEELIDRIMKNEYISMDIKDRYFNQLVNYLNEAFDLIYKEELLKEKMVESNRVYNKFDEIVEKMYPKKGLYKKIILYSFILFAINIFISIILVFLFKIRL